jgi:NhaA family Na+:H+ antiporter
MAVPALLYLALAGEAGFSKGWAIPSATDIAFALGVLSLLGSRVPAALKAFLLAVAVVDDLGAILIVAFFYTEQVLADYLLWSVGVSAVLLTMNRLKIPSIGLYILVGMVLWVVMYQSGISPTIGGVIVAACVPLKAKDGHSPLHAAEHSFRPWVLFGIMPVFAFANAGINLSGAGHYLTHPITLGSAIGLALGKPLGIAAMTYLGALLMGSSKPGNVKQIIGVGCIAGVGFTMSLFVGALAFSDPALATPVRLGVYAGSIFSAWLGLLILHLSLPRAISQTVMKDSDQTRPFIMAEPKYQAHDKAKP